MRFSGLLSYLLTGNPFSEKERAEVRNEVDFSEAIKAHLAWKHRLLDAISGHGHDMPVASEVGKDTACTLGQWIHGHGHERYGGLSSFDELRSLHARFHHVARDIVELSSAKRTDEAKHLVQNEFHQTSCDIIARIHHLSSVFKA